MARWNYKNHQDRFLSHVILSGDEDCWEWTASKNTKGYGQFMYKIKGRRIHGMAHRFSFIIHKGKIPKGMCVLHHCDNPGCVNPKHLWIGTNQDNMDDRNRKGRQAHLRGSASGLSKLVEEEVIEIKNIIKEGKLFYPEIAKLYGVCRSTIAAISTGQNWGWLG